MPQKMEEHRKKMCSVRMLLQVYSCIIEWAPVTMSQLSLLPLRALPYSSVGDEAYQSSSHHIRKGQKKQVKLLGLPSPNPNLDFGLSLLTSSKHLMATHGAGPGKKIPPRMDCPWCSPVLIAESFRDLIMAAKHQNQNAPLPAAWEVSFQSPQLQVAHNRTTMRQTSKLP